MPFANKAITYLGMVAYIWLYQPEATHDQYQQQKPAVEYYLHQDRPSSPKLFLSLPFWSVEEVNRDKGKEKKFRYTNPWSPATPHVYHRSVKAPIFTIM